MLLDQWADRWNIPFEAMTELRGLMGVGDTTPTGGGGSEAMVQQRLRLEASRRGARLWQNNIGAATDESGRHIRYGLANESAQINSVLKSSDLIGITPMVLEGRTVGVFTSIECKRPGWRYTGTPREKAQLAWIKLILSLGGIAKFSTGELE